MFNARLISLAISLGVAVISVAFLSLISTMTATDLFLVFALAFISSFILFFLTLELLVYRELRKIFRIFDQLSGKKTTTTSPSEISVKKIGKELSAFAKMKEEEIETLRRIENFRREFLADISHELKTPVFAAQGFIHTLMDGAIDDVSVRTRFLKKSAKSLDDLNNLVQDLITISQVETGEIILQEETFELGTLVNEVFEKMEVKAGNRNTDLRLKKDYKGDARVVADYFRIMQVITNLVDNAIKYGKDGGRVIVTLSAKKDSVEVNVSDDGPGIPLEHQPKIFRRFYRVDKSRSREKGGTGLGLAIVKHIVEAHKSEIKLNSKEGKGTRFTFRLPKEKSVEKTSV